MIMIRNKIIFGLKDQSNYLGIQIVGIILYNLYFNKIKHFMFVA